MIYLNDLIKDYFIVCGIISNIFTLLFLINKIYSELTYKTQNRIKGIISLVNIYNYIKTACGFNRKEIDIFYKDKYMKNNFFMQ